MAYSRMAKVEGALMLYQSLRANGSVFFFRPFLPLDNLLFFPTAMFAADAGKVGGERDVSFGGSLSSVAK